MGVFMILGQQISTKKENEGERQRGWGGREKDFRKRNLSSPGPVEG